MPITRARADPPLGTESDLLPARAEPEHLAPAPDSLQVCAAGSTGPITGTPVRARPESSLEVMVLLLPGTKG